MAGLFYLKDAQALRDAVIRLSTVPIEKAQARAVIVPHGGLHQSGKVIGQTLGSVKIPRRVVILGPNHTGWGESWSVRTNGAYATPLGEVLIDEIMAEQLLAISPVFQADDLGHQGEHSIEVLLPFLRHLGPVDMTITPVVVRSESLGECDRAAEAIAICLRQLHEPALVIASADLSRYEPRETVQEKDARVIESILTLNSQLVRDQLTHINGCGLASIATALTAAKQLGASAAQLVQYGTSADAGGDPQSATGYAGIIIS